MDKMKTNLLTLSAVLMGYEACLRGVRHPPVSDVQAVIFLGQRSILFLISTCKLQKQNKEWKLNEYKYCRLMPLKQIRHYSY